MARKIITARVSDSEFEMIESNRIIQDLNMSEYIKNAVIFYTQNISNEHLIEEGFKVMLAKMQEQIELQFSAINSAIRRLERDGEAQRDLNNMSFSKLDEATQVIATMNKLITNANARREQ